MSVTDSLQVKPSRSYLRLGIEVPSSRGGHWAQGHPNSAVATSGEEQEEAGCEVALALQLYMDLAQPQTLSDSSVLCNSFSLSLPQASW